MRVLARMFHTPAKCMSRTISPKPTRYDRANDDREAASG